MELGYYLDPETSEPHIYRHAESEDEVEAVLEHPQEDRPATEGARIALGQTQAGRYLRAIYVPDPTPGSICVITAYEPGPAVIRVLRRRRRRKR